MCKLFISLFLFLEYRFLVESPTKVAIKTEFSKLFPIFFPVNNHIIKGVPRLTQIFLIRLPVHGIVNLTCLTRERCIMRRYQGWVDCRFSRDADCHGWSGAGSRLGDSMESLGRDCFFC